MNIPLSPCVPENLVSRDGFSRPVPRQPAHLHIQAESGAYLLLVRDSSRVPRRRPFMRPPYAIGSVPSLSGHAIAYRWRSLPRVRRHRASKPQGSSERVLPWQITMDKLIFVQKAKNGDRRTTMYSAALTHGLSIKHTLQRCCQGWLYGGCFLPPPRPRFPSNMHLNLASG